MVQRDSGGRIAIGAPVNDDQATPKKYVDDGIATKTTKGQVVLTTANAMDTYYKAANGYAKSGAAGWHSSGECGFAILGYMPETYSVVTDGEIMQIAWDATGGSIKGRIADTRDVTGKPVWYDPFTFITSANINAFQSDYDPIGAITVGPWNSLPGSLKMVGQLVNRADYPKLWTFVNTYGYIVQDQYRTTYPGAFTTGNGTTTFRLPDMRGLFVRGQGGVSAELCVLQTDAIRDITGKFTVGNRYNSKATPTVNNGVGAFRTADGTPKVNKISTYDNDFGKTDGYDVMFHASLSVPTAVENRPVNVAWNYFIRAF